MLRAMSNEKTGQGAKYIRLLQPCQEKCDLNHICENRSHTPLIVEALAIIIHEDMYRQRKVFSQ